jgi:cytosine permease
MQTLKQVLTLNDYEQTAVPTNERRHLTDITMVWIGFAVTMSIFMLGMNIGLGLTFWNMVWVLLITGVILTIIDIMSSVVAYKTGLTWALVSRYVFGRQGQRLPVFVAALIYMGWMGFNLTWAPNFAKDAFGWSFLWLVVISGVIYTLTAYIGFAGLKWLSRVCVPLFVILCVYLIGAAIAEGGWTGLTQAQPAKPMPVSAAIAALIGIWLTASLTGALDVNRFCKSTAAAIHSSWIQGVFRTFIIFSGGVTAIAFGTGHPGAVLAMIGLAGIGFVLIFLIMWTTSDNSAYSGALTFAGAIPLSKKVWVLVIMIFGTVVAAIGVLGFFPKWLTLISAVLPSVLGIMVVELWVLHKAPFFGGKPSDNPELYELSNWRASAFISWLVATVAGVWMYIVKVPWAFAWVFLLAIVLHIILSLIIKQRQQRIPGWN